MRADSLLVAIAVIAAAALAGLSRPAPGLAPILADKRPGAVPVDAELVIAVDVSNSMDPEEQALQREGYILGLTSREFLQAVRNGSHGKVAIRILSGPANMTRESF